MPKILHPRSLLTVLLVIALPLSAHALGNPSLPANPCLSGKIKCLTKRTSCLLSCYAKAAKGGLALDTVMDPCLVKCRAKFDGGVNGPAAGCFGKLEAKGGCLFLGDAPPIAARSDVFALTAVARLDPAPLNNASSCRSGKLKCVSKYDKCVQGLFAKAAKAGGVIDSVKLAKCVAVITGGNGGVAASCFGKLEAKGGCETTNDTGFLRDQDDAYIDATVHRLRLGALDQNNQRCSGDTSVKCTTAPGGVVGCGGPLGTCEFYFGSPQPLAMGGVSACLTNQWAGGVGGTFNPETGASVWTGGLLRRLYVGGALYQPCPRCVGDAAQNDGLANGLCSGGARNNQPCDANGVTSVTEFGASSFDCPPTPAGVIATELADLAAITNTGAASITLSTASPTCNGAPGKRCACGSCSGNSSIACRFDADCVAAAAGSCTNAAGAPRQPNSCVDFTSDPGDGSLCIDTAPVGDGSGECPEAPTDQHCAVEAFRFCLGDEDCPAPGDSCVSAQRRCYLDNGVVGGSVTALGGHSSPVEHASYSTFASAHCLAPSSSGAVNFVMGLPGAGRLRVGGMLADNGTDVACPSRASFVVTDADGIVDFGWTGLGQDQRFVMQSKLSFAVTGCANATPPCGSCTFTGPVANPDAPLPPSKTVFISSTTTSGNMGNLAGADAICDSLADAAGFSGTFKAWLSSAAASAASRLTHSADDYALPDGTVIANGWTDLTDGTLDAPIDMDENGATVSADVWTNSTIAGAIDASECLQWTSTTPGHKGQTGVSTATNAAWTENIDFEDCAQLRHLYCFEQ